MGKRNLLRDSVAKAGAKVARCEVSLMMAKRELEIAQKAVMAEPAKPKNYLYRVQLLAAGTQKISVIKVVRSLTNLGLKEAKDLTDFANSHSPPVVLDNVNESDAKHALDELTYAGAAVRMVKCAV